MAENTTKTIAVVGGSGGLGAEICRQLAAQGHLIVIGYHSRQALAEEVAATIHAAGGKAFTRAVNLCDERQVLDFLDYTQTCAKDADSSLGGVVNAAGPAIPLRPLIEISSAEFRRIMTTDVEGSFNLLTSAARIMAASGGGPIVQLLTTAVLRTLENDAMSGVPKMAIEGIVRQLARELGPKNVRVNGIAPGVMNVGIVHGSFAADPVAERVIQSCLDRTPMPRMGKPEEISALVAFLLGDAAAYINGQVIGVDGGYSA
jgi:3-oxoacyl-[acyl-carrier protein] reductase